MRRETESFNRWKKAKEQELSKLKDQERKRQYQMMRMENHYSKQQNVLKRKVEEAHAINKRLKEALEVQRKVKQHSSEKNTNTENIKDWINQELELLFSVNNAELTLQRLLQDRSDHAVKLEKLKTDKMARESPTYQNDLDELVQNVELRSAQIAQLQREILESDQENRCKSRWQTVRSMADAKTALNIVFEIVGDIHKREIAKNWEYEELIDTCDQQHLKIRQSELQAIALKAEYEQKLAKLQSEYEQDVMDCIEHLRGTNENSNIENTENTWLKRELKMYKERCQALEQEREEAWKNNESANNSKATGHTKTKKSKFTVDENQDPRVVWKDIFSDDSFGADDDNDNDPDWRKTPLYKRTRKTVSVLTDLSKDDVQPLKRSSGGEIKCSCKTNCSTRLCTCRRHKTSCSNCNCQTDICKNRNTKTTEFDYFPDDPRDTTVDDVAKRLKLEHA
ncbi:chromosome-associated kinesin KIF4 isoform X1 [Cephus cinctus]|uniref:Chromosome-associated kinesin KIF4 isoform X1 n=2 Tax=Cephus cinctus TaxID=211228 RepID=A0AAJ7FTS3_CEPCN|nr:chromosome-associated kinesin KIF4 isoform X1 [Cephus cinctus]